MQAKELGASDTVNYKDNPKWDEAVLKLTNGEGVDHVIEVGGSETAQKALAASRVGGNIHTVGGVSGWDTGFPLRNVLWKAIHIRGILIGTFVLHVIIQDINAPLFR